MTAKIPVYRLNTSDPATTFDTMDFTNDTQVVVRWTTARIFYNYDEHFGNTSSNFDYSGLTSQQDFDTKSTSLTRNSWLPFDPTLKFISTNNTQGQTIFANSNLNVATFFSNYLQ